jgi:predicted RNase H-like nuclease (RuvC/YqgF family)
MPHDPEDVIRFAMKEHASQAEKIERLTVENRKLRAVIEHMSGEIRKIAEELKKAIDRNIH